ncbi:MAG TPA: hypothetical protein VMR76_01575 [Candidatus Saccharimonadia bacterium]|nr:hypothetical protein [Candidatus Saccharimonadia bacterium]
MTAEDQLEYLIARNDTEDVKRLRIFYAPICGGLVVPKEVLRVVTRDSILGGKVWQLMTGKLDHTEVTVPTIEPSSIEQVGEKLGEFMKANPIGGMIIDGDAPDEIREKIESVSSANALETVQDLAELLGVEVGDIKEDTRPWPGMYL